MEFKFNLKAHMDSFKTDDGFDYEKAQTSFQEQLNKFAAKNKPNMEELKAEVKTEATNDFIKGLKLDGVENVDQFNAYIKRLGASSNELTEANKRLTTDIDSYKEKVEEFEKTNTELSGKVTGYEQSLAVVDKGFNAKYKNSVIAEAKARVTEELDFNGALDLVAKDYPEWIGKKSKGSPTPQGGNLTPDEEDKKMRRMMGLPVN